MSTWLNRGASGGLAGASIKRRFQATANSHIRLTHRNSDTPVCRGWTLTVIAATKAREFQRGDTVTFDDRDGRSITGVIVRINQRTATIGTATADGGTWRVPFHMLRHVLDI